jgi:hypothetical protein
MTPDPLLDAALATPPDAHPVWIVWLVGIILLVAFKVWSDE